MRRFFFSELPDKEGAVFSVPQDQIKHLTRVLRLKEGDTLQMSSGGGGIYEGIIVYSSPEEVSIKITGIKQGGEIPLLCTAFIAELKNMDEALSNLAEHGVQNIIPFYASRSIPKFDQKQALKKQERRQKLADEAVKKVGGLYQSTVHPTISFNQIKTHIEGIPQKILFYEKSDSQSLGDLDFKLPSAFFIGPEGGFTDKEAAELIAMGAESHSLGTRILRAPQAASAAASIIRYLTENLFSLRHSFLLINIFLLLHCANKLS